MCIECRNRMRNVIQCLVDPDKPQPEEVEGLWEHVDLVVAEYVKNLHEYAEENDIELPEDAEEQVRDCVIASQIGLAAAAIASRTDNFTREGGVEPSIVLGMWAGEVMQYEIHRDATEIMKSHLGMGEN